MRISDWSSDVCSSDLLWRCARRQRGQRRSQAGAQPDIRLAIDLGDDRVTPHCGHEFAHHAAIFMRWLIDGDSLDPGEDTFAIPHRDRRLQRLFLEPFSKVGFADGGNDRLLVGKVPRSEEHTSELPSLMRHSYAVFCLKKNKT